MTSKSEDKVVAININDLDALTNKYNLLTKDVQEGKRFFCGEELIFGCNELAIHPLVNRRYQFGGLDPVENPMLFTNKLAPACKRRATYEEWVENLPKSKSESDLRGYSAGDMIQGSPYVKEAHWTLVNIYVAHEARAYFGLDVPGLVTPDDIAWCLKDDEEAKVVAEGSTKFYKERAKEITRRAAMDGKILAEGKEGVLRYRDGVVRNMQEDYVAREKAARRLQLKICAIMEATEYAKQPEGADDTAIQKAIGEQVKEIFGRLVKFLETTRDRMLKLSRSVSKNGREAVKVVDYIDALLNYTYTDEYAAEIAERLRKVDEILADL